MLVDITPPGMEVYDNNDDRCHSNGAVELASSPGPPLSFFHFQEETRERVRVTHPLPSRATKEEGGAWGRGYRRMIN